MAPSPDMADGVNGVAANHSAESDSSEWAQSLAQLAKTAELKKHALTLQLCTAEILAARLSFDSRSKALQDVKAQVNRLESERQRLLDSLQQINSDKEKLQQDETTIFNECSEWRAQIEKLTEGSYATSRRQVDALREELGQPPLPSLQSQIEEQAFAQVNERRLKNGTEPAREVSQPPSGDGEANVLPEVPARRPRGRPKGSKNKAKNTDVPA